MNIKIHALQGKSYEDLLHVSFTSYRDGYDY
jgi:hypothetical protein